MNRTLDLTFWILLGATCLLAGAVAMEDLGLLILGVQKSGQLLGGVLPELLLGFLIAGLIDVAVPQPVLVRWLGDHNLAYGIAIGWGMGLVIPGGPYLLFPLAATLLREGAAPGPLIAMLTAKVLLSPIRIISFEAPSLGWTMTLARCLPSLLLPPIIGWIGHWLFYILRR